MASFCWDCCSESVEKKQGDFIFDPPANIPGGVITIPNAIWEECGICGECVLPPELLKRLDEVRLERLERGLT